MRLEARLQALGERHRIRCATGEADESVAVGGEAHLLGALLHDVT
jgi:hypothetical protein